MNDFLETKLGGSGIPPTAQQIQEFKTTFGLEKVVNLDTSNVDNHVDGVDNKVFKQTDKDAITTNALDIVNLEVTVANPPLTWHQLVQEFSQRPTTEAILPTGTVRSSILKGITRFRFIPSPYDPTQDAFYESWDGSNLTGIIATRG